ncbi:hypothetical protein DXU93_08360 [Brumimicrobium aurantiacum]|uniref:T9SS C-terminal target domain-containing protein n=1 Tax=Brumimicrobium aurantiacum TaxID=1737063 RepID=A0A3E1EY76_9FLAO|nr:hypothetical protein DXU93_08360 [Brumimicrobium aurantiacum]
MQRLKVGGLLVAATLTLATTSCKKEGCTDETAINYSEEAKKDDGSCEYEETVSDESTVVVSSNITENTTWTSDKVYVLNTRVAVTSGATLTIEPGTIIKGEVGTGPNATALIIARGAKINAEGDANNPIIFTTVADEIQPGEIDSPNMDANLDGLWGGLIVLGNAPISADNPSVQIEGIPASDQNGLYGGADASDNSGVLKYISIRHGGANIGEGNEINGLTLGGVGTGTVIENIEVVSNQDDGVEWFGGTVNVKNVIVWNAGDDALDTDQAWGGTLDNFIVIGGESTDHAMEIDGPEGAYLDAHTLKNGSVKGADNTELADFRDGARASLENVYFFGFADPATDGRGDFSLSGQASIDNYGLGFISLSNIETTLPSGVMLTDVFKEGTDADATNVSEGANTVGANVGEFLGWTLSDKRGELSNF